MVLCVVWFFSQNLSVKIETSKWHDSRKAMPNIPYQIAIERRTKSVTNILPAIISIFPSCFIFSNLTHKKRNFDFSNFFFVCSRNSNLTMICFLCLSLFLCMLLHAWHILHFIFWQISDWDQSSLIVRVWLGKLFLIACSYDNVFPFF